MHSIQFGNTTIPFSLSWKELKRIAITVNEDCSVSVVAPKGVNTDKVYAVVKKKAGWILEKQSIILERANKPAQKEFISGESFLYLGKSYRLKIAGDRVVLKNGRLYAPKDNTREQLIDWYKEKALVQFNIRMNKFIPLVKKIPTKLILGEQKNRWGSCDKKGVLRINWKVVMAPSKIVDYVIAHEITHLQVAGHSELFWKTLVTIMQDYPASKKWLMINGASLDVL